MTRFIGGTISTQSIIKYLSLVVALFIMMSAVYFIESHHITSLTRDQWVIYQSYLKDDWWRAAVSVRNGHRVVFPAFFVFADIHWFHASNSFLVRMALLFNLFSLVIILLQIERESLANRATKVLLIGLVITQLFWLGNFTQQGWGLNAIIFYGLQFSFLLAISCLMKSLSLFNASLQRRSGSFARSSLNVYLYLYAALGLAYFCALSFGTGMAIWPVFIILAWLQRAEASVHRHILFHLLLCTIIYLYLPGREVIHQQLHFDLKTILMFTLKLMGSPFYYSALKAQLISLENLQLLSTLIGAVALCSGVAIVLVTCYRRIHLNSLQATALALILLGIGASLLITIGRTYFLDPFADRYVFWPILFWLGLLLWFSEGAFAVWRLERTGVVILVSLYPLILLHSHFAWGDHLFHFSQKLRIASLSFKTGVLNYPDTAILVGWPQQVKERAFGLLPSLYEADLNMFADQRYQLIGQQLQEGMQDEKGRHCNAVVTRQQAVMGDQLLGLFPAGKETQLGFGQDHLMAVKLFGLLKRPDDENGFILVVNREGTILGIGELLKSNGFSATDGWLSDSTQREGKQPFAAYSLLNKQERALRLFWVPGKNGHFVSKNKLEDGGNPEGCCAVVCANLSVHGH